MEATKILQADLLDIIFEGKNKMYGAYDLRKTYNTRMKKALLVMAALIIFLFVGSVVYSQFVHFKSDTTLAVTDTELGHMPDETPAPPPPPPPPLTPPPTTQVNQVIFTPPVIVPNDQVDPNDRIEEIDDSKAISTQTVVSDNVKPIIQAPVEDVNTHVVETPKDVEPAIFLKVEKEAEFPGGISAWSNYLRKNLNPGNVVENGAPAGTYQVIVRFIVSKDGEISDVVAETKFGYGMEEQAVQAIRKGPNWVPALQNGRNVNAYRRQPITFVVNENGD